ncbi:hypothetical protein [Paenibacillus sp. FSL L8-0709]|uniref:hypothetical protein n=1 Tax=Paenibacillus sp. FSL L8-0709 TaxID=2975312 RepID=UPI0030FBE155
MYTRVKEHPRYFMELKEDKSVLFCCVNGTYTEADGLSSINAFNEVVETLNPATTTLIIDCNGLQAQPQQLAALLLGCFKMYKETGFKEVHLVGSSSMTQLSQMKRLAKEAELEVKFIKSFERN